MPAASAGQDCAIIAPLIGKLLRALRKRLLLVGLLLPMTELVAHFWWAADLLTHFRVYWCILAVFLFSFECLVKPRRGWGIILAAALTIYVALPVARYFVPQPSAPHGGNRLSFCSVNVLYSNKDYESVRSYLSQEQPDACLFLETGATWASELKALDDLYPHRIEALREHAFGILLMSKHPVLDHEILPSADSETPMLDVVLDTPLGAIRCLCVHPLPPVRTENSTQNLKWLRMAAQIASKDSVELPTVLLGDLNATPFTPRFRKLVRESGLRDSALGFGVTQTWHSPIPLLGLPIDHILVSQEFVVTDRFVGPDVGSDHRPVMVQLAIKESR